jgi:hypothetical protein
VKHILLVLGIAIGAIFLTPTAALACSCVHSTVAKQIADAETIVDATLTWESTNELETSYGIAVGTLYKGKATAIEKLQTQASVAACGLGDLATSGRYLFFIRGEHPGQLTVDACGGSTPYDATLAAQIRSATGSAKAIGGRPADLEVTSAAESSGTSLWKYLIALVVLTGIALVAATAVSRRRIF